VRYLLFILLLPIVAAAGEPQHYHYHKSRKERTPKRSSSRVPPPISAPYLKDKPKEQEVDGDGSPVVVRALEEAEAEFYMSQGARYTVVPGPAKLVRKLTIPPQQEGEEDVEMPAQSLNDVELQQPGAQRQEAQVRVEAQLSWWDYLKCLCACEGSRRREGR
jgi:hypothetical protein